MKEKTIPVIESGKTIVIRMNGTYEETFANAKLKIRGGHSDIIITVWDDHTLHIISRICNRSRDGAGKSTNNYIFTPAQTKVLIQILTVEFPKTPAVC